jgi:hypothetical protein
MLSWTYTDQKKDLEFCFENGDFAPSAKYKTQSPFNATKSYPSKSTWDLWFVELSNYSFTFTVQDVILVTYNIEAVLMLIEDFGIAPASITLLSDNDNKTALAQAWGVTVITDCKEIPEMKFTHVIKNPPWDKGIYTEFWPLAYEALVDDGYQIDILPTNWMTLPGPRMTSARKHLLENFQILSIRIYDNSKRQVFDANTGGGDVVVMVSRKCKNPDNTMVEYTYFNNPTFTVDLTKYDFIPLYKSGLSVSILNKVLSSKLGDLECDYQTADKVVSTHLTPFYVTGNNLAHSRENLNTNSWTVSQPSTNTDAWFLYYDSPTSAQLHYEWYKSDLFAYIISVLKSQAKTQVKQLAITGKHNFTNNDFTSYFGFTKQHLDEVAQWKLNS